VADGDAAWYDSESSMTLENWNDEQWLTGVPRLSTRDDVYRGYFIPKGQIDFQLRILLFCLFGNLPLIIWAKRIYDGSQCMVKASGSIANNLNVYLRDFQGNPSRPGDIPRPRGIQAGAFSQRRRDRPRRSNTLISIWHRQENLCGTSLC
jgi:hypothetical protein